MANQEIQEAEARKILDNLIKKAFKEGFLAALSMFDNRCKEIKKNGVIDLFADGYVELWHKSSEEAKNEKSDEQKDKTKAE